MTSAPHSRPRCLRNVGRPVSAWVLASITAIRLSAAIVPTGEVAPLYPAGNPDPWNVGDALLVGDSAVGSLSIDGGSDVMSSGGTQGFNPLVTGTVTVADAGSTWINSGDLLLGVFGTGKLNVLGSGRVENQSAFLGQVNGTGQALVSGSGSQWLSAGNLVVGNAASGQLTIEQQGFVHSNSGRIGLNPSATGTVIVDGQQSAWEVANSLSVGDPVNGGMASLSLTGAGSRVYIGGTAKTQGAMLPVTETAVVISGTGSTAQLSIYGGNTVQSSGAAYLGVGAGESGSALILGAGTNWQNGGNVYVGQGGSGTLTLASGGMVSTGGIVSVGANGLVTGMGTVVGAVENSGAVAPGQSIGSLMIAGNYTQSAAGKLQIELAGTSAGSFDTLTSSAQIVLAGTLDVNLAMNGGTPFEPQVGNAFQILTASVSLSGTFTNFELPALGAGRMWRIHYGPTTASLAVTLAGDYNDNGIVDAADYTVWRDLQGGAYDPRADGDTNGVVDVLDFNIWKANFGLTAGPGGGSVSAAASVPEPAALLLGMSLLAILSLISRSPRR
jgi:T5SS/PEP-CTERM-associated repeat protein